MAHDCVRGFTLLEMIIVIAIVVLLLALLVPLVREAMAQVRIVHCQNNLRELHKCIRQYWNEHGGEFPPMRAMGRNDRLIRRMGERARLTPAEVPNAGGYHWSLILWPYHHNLDLYVCPCDPNGERRGDLTGKGVKTGSPFVDAPPESYGLNTLLFRMTPALRKTAGASWGLKASEFGTDLTFTTLNEQKQWIPRLDARILMFCGTAGCTVGHQSNTAWRDGALPGVARYEWHPWPEAGPFEDETGCGSNYLFFGGQVEYRGDFPSRFEWALDLNE